MVKRTRSETQTNEAVNELLGKYISEVEKMVLKYPEQWFNYYNFWEQKADGNN